jgi:hypothetical protein
MLSIYALNQKARKKLHKKVLQMFRMWCLQEYQFFLYDYELEIASALLHSLIVEKKDVFTKCARQAGKTETVTLMLRFLIRFFVKLFMEPLMCGIASPKGEQAKTDIDRIKKTLEVMRRRWKIEDRENNTHTVRAYIRDVLAAEMYRFSLMPTTNNESKTLNVLVVEEAHKADDKKRSDELDPMLASTDGVTWHFGVGCVRDCDFRKGCDGELEESVSLSFDVDRIIADRRKMYEATGDERHLNYEHTFLRELKKKGKMNPEIRRNYYLEDMLEISDYISMKRLQTMRRASDIEVSTETLYIGIDWAKKQDRTIVTVMNDELDIVDWLVYQKMSFREQCIMIDSDLEERGYMENVMAVRADSTGVGDAAMEILLEISSLPIGDESHVVFSPKSKNAMYTAFDEILFTDDEERKFSYPSDHPYTEIFEEEMTKLQREYKGDGEYLCPSHPEGDDEYDDFCDSGALAVFGATEGTIGDIITTA